MPARDIEVTMLYPPAPPGVFELPYTGERLAWALEVIGWPKNELCRQLELDHGTVRQWLNGRRRIPDALGFWLEYLAQVHLTFARPVNWRDKPAAPGGLSGANPGEDAQDAEDDLA